MSRLDSTRLPLQIKLRDSLLDHKPSTQNNGRFVDIVMLVTGTRRQLGNPSASHPRRKKEYIPQSTNTTSLENKRRMLQWHPDPPHRERAENMPMRNDQHITLLVIAGLETLPVVILSNIRDKGVNSPGDVLGGSVGTIVSIRSVIPAS